MPHPPRGTSQLAQEARYCDASYLDVASGPIKNWRKISVNGNTAYHYRDNQGHKIVFRGTNELRDWKESNLKFSPHPKCNDYKAHYGFYQGALDMVDALKRDGLHPDYPVQIYGHSLGAAIGLQASMQLAPEFSIARVVLFGCPRTMNEDGVGVHRELGLVGRTIRVVNGADPVCRVLLSLGTLEKVSGILREQGIGLPQIGAHHPDAFTMLTNHHDTGQWFRMGAMAWQKLRREQPDTLGRMRAFAGALREGVDRLRITDDHMIGSYIKALDGTNGLQEL